MNPDTLAIYSLRLLVTFSLWASTCFFATASADEDCSRIEEPAARLQCYDRQQPPKVRRSEGRSVSGQVTEQTEEEGRLPDTPELTPDEETTPLPARSEQQKTSGKRLEKENAGRSKKRSPGLPGWFQGKKQPTMQATIVEVRNRDRQKMILLLDNGELWLQTTPRSLPFHPGDTVNIHPGTMGGYIIRNSKGVSSRFSLVRH